MPDYPEDLAILKGKAHIVQCRKGVEFFRQVTGSNHEQYPCQSDLPGVKHIPWDSGSPFMVILVEKAGFNSAST
jgi:hypothetical protein